MDDDMTDEIASFDDDLDDRSMVHHVDGSSRGRSAVVAGLFYFTAFLVLALVVAGVYLFAASLRLISQVEDFMRSVGFRVQVRRSRGDPRLRPDPRCACGVPDGHDARRRRVRQPPRHRQARRPLPHDRRRGTRTPRARVPTTTRPRPSRTTRSSRPHAARRAAGRRGRVSAPPLAAAVDEETSIDDWVKAPGDDVDAPPRAATTRPRRRRSRRPLRGRRRTLSPQRSRRPKPRRPSRRAWRRSWRRRSCSARP